MKVFVGLSGGVDSAVSAALLQQQGHEVTGVFIRIALKGYPCNAGEDKISAQRVAAHLKIPFIEIDLSKEYKDEVFTYAISELREGRTPNPDTLCNQKIKFGAFYAFARMRGVECVATGHYARVKNGLLYKGADADKDQSYFLWMVPQKVLKHVLFPIGDMRKTEVRTLAAKFALPNATRPDSQGLCFLGDLSIEEMIGRELKPLPGDVLDEAGTIVGRHDGAALYTMGQRHGFELFSSIGGRGVDTLPHFVIAKNSAANTITVSTERFPVHYKHTEITLTRTNWIGALGGGPCLARFRYRQPLISADIEIKNGKAIARLHEPHYMPYGQSLVLYRGEQCMGGGIIEAAQLC
ncbi:MAG: tRNA 2-thiouridine(34) synthase MnmA [Minisyncoccia bacterium]|jgi:tRNA-specific 2-thiouridylase